MSELKPIINSVYINRLNPSETIKVTNISEEEMWGFKGKELVFIIEYEIITSSIGVSPSSTLRFNKTTSYNFYDKFI